MVPCPNKGFTVKCDRVFVNLDVPRDKEMKKVVLELTKEENKRLLQPVGYSGVDLNAVFAYIRQEETNICNFLGDVVNFINKSDCTIFNSGSVRAD